MGGTAIAQPLKFLRRAGPHRVLVIGGGLAGLFTALKLAPLPVTVLSPRPLGEGASSTWAQGGIAAAIGEGDSAGAHAADTIAAGAGLTDPEMARILTSEAGQRIEDLLRYGVPFDRDTQGKPRLSQEAAHSARRVVRVGGDQAGKAVMTAVIAAVARTPSISVLENTEAVELVRQKGRIVGVYARRPGEAGPASFLPGCAVVLAAGGIGALYRVTTNPMEARGGALAMAARAGAIIADPEFVQFHPTAFDIGRDPAPLLSEAIRGDGALLVNRAGERFMPAVHPRAELAPRDVVARAVHREIAEGRGAFLDCRALPMETAFPTAYEVCREVGIDPAREPIPIAPAAHYHMGGVLTDARGRTSLTGLWACGEAACTGVHGANRLASNSLLEAVVFAARAAADIAGEAQYWRALSEDMEPVAETVELAEDDAAKGAEAVQRLRGIMARDVGVERSGASLQTALCALKELEAEARSAGLRGKVEAAMLITAGAYARKESRGAHRRLDYPETVEPAHHTYLTLGEARKVMETAAGGEAQDSGAGCPLRAAV